GSKYASLKEDDPYTITRERALEVVAAKKEADANRIVHDFAEEGIQVLNGRFGPYVTDGERNAKVPKDVDPKSLTLPDCRKLLAEAPVRPRRGGRKAAAKKAEKAPAKKAPAKKKKKTAAKKKKKTAARKKKTTES